MLKKPSGYKNINTTQYIVVKTTTTNVKNN